MPSQMEVHAVLTHEPLLAAIFHTRVAHVHDAIAGHHCVDALEGVVEVFVVASDDYGALEIHDLRCHLEAVPLDLAEATHVVARKGLVQVQHRGHTLAHLAAEDLHIVEPEPRPGRLRACCTPAPHAV
eukprot:CAMPEP_0180796216 /NCGR_PEP_ID=MMETSP1038_2-20121128/56656_1 /TAXON_ID=632150 /ORGANISM="Azadinium spinosum, Strain 3D9" /LENGTH=127 /DNA_ID=CAMNT_0022835271 /DNA_START=316 /DNA_END=695 /DNA_ORIENTATION=+